MTRGGLDRFLAPEAGDYSNLPDRDSDSSLPESLSQMNCTGVNKDQPVCQIAEAERAREAEKKVEATLRHDRGDDRKQADQQ